MIIPCEIFGQTQFWPGNKSTVAAKATITPRGKFICLQFNTDDDVGDDFDDRDEHINRYLKPHMT